jgi:transcriptional regulator with XRE-family HTH domain
MLFGCVHGHDLPSKKDRFATEALQLKSI